MARHLGDEAFAKICLAKWKQGAAKMDQTLWGGEYYIQSIEDVDAYRYQYGIGCLADQVFGQLLAHVNGLGYVLPKDHIQQAIHSIYCYNFHSSMRGHASVQRTYALNDEAGLLLCSWPKGGRPRFPFVYSDEVWTGIEYQVAAHLMRNHAERVPFSLMQLWVNDCKSLVNVLSTENFSAIDPFNFPAVQIVLEKDAAEKAFG